jgi:hypothetical protein
VTGFNPRPSGIVNSLALSGNTLYAGGDFQTVSAAASQPGGGGRDRRSATWAPAADDLVKGVDMAADEPCTSPAASRPSARATGTSPRSTARARRSRPFSHGLSYAVVDMAVDASGVFIAAPAARQFRRPQPDDGTMMWRGGTDGNVQAIATLDGVVYVVATDSFCGMQGGQRAPPRSSATAAGGRRDDGRPDELEPARQQRARRDAAGRATLGVGGDFTRIGAAPGRASQSSWNSACLLKCGADRAGPSTLGYAVARRSEPSANSATHAMSVDDPGSGARRAGG